MLIHVSIGIIVFDQSLFNDHDRIWRSVEIIMGVYWAECSCQSGRSCQKLSEFFSFHAAHGHNLHSTHIIFSTVVDKLVLSLTMCSSKQRDLQNLNCEPLIAARSLPAAH